MNVTDGRTPGESKDRAQRGAVKNNSHHLLKWKSFKCTLCTKVSGAVYCNRSCLWLCLFVCLWVCYHDNSKLRASILTKLGL